MVCGQNDAVKMQKPTHFTPSVIRHTCSKCGCKWIFKYSLMRGAPGKVNCEAKLEMYSEKLVEMLKDPKFSGQLKEKLEKSETK